MDTSHRGSWTTRSPLLCRALWPEHARHGDLMMAGGNSYCRACTVCGGDRCSNWIWSDKIREGYLCRRCGEKWSRPPQGFSKAPTSRSPKRTGRQQMPVKPPPGLGTKPYKVTKIQKATAEVLAPAWSSLDQGPTTAPSGPRHSASAAQPGSGLERCPGGEHGAVTTTGSGARGETDVALSTHGKGHSVQAQDPGLPPEGPLPQEDSSSAEDRLHEAVLSGFVG